ncbi:MAG TPA: ATP-binding cassette domain-containing protein [Cytophagales bacterium]|nr:ATP-binding cassette domain-containing protein [Cytophagales bacterium]
MAINRLNNLTLNQILSLNNISKSFRKLKALDNLSLTVEEGSVYGILGPNGSGKTTALGIALGVINADSGSYSWFGRTEDGQRKRIGALLETPNFYPYLSALQNLKISAAIKGVKEEDAHRVLEIVKLSERKNSKFSTYSLGMKQRLAIAAALLGNPEVLVLDEPTNGLDPQGIAEVRELIINLGQSGKTILLASHIIEEVEKVCSHVVVIKKGQKLAEGEISDVLHEEEYIILDTEDKEKLHGFLSNSSYVKNILKEKDRLKISLSNGYNAYELNKQLVKEGIVVSHLETKKKSLETKFLELTK